MRSLIIGCAGQDGFLLSKLLVENDEQVWGTKKPSTGLPKDHPLKTLNKIFDIDSTNSNDLIEIIQQFGIEKIYYLSGITSISSSIKNPEGTFLVNYFSYEKLLKQLVKLGFRGQVIYASSTEIYSNKLNLIEENSVRVPSNTYGESKLKAVQLDPREFGANFTVSNAIMSNHESFLRSEDFVTGKLAKGLALIHKKQINKLKFGNIDVKKDWAAASEVVEALYLIAKGTHSGDFLLASGKLSSLLDIIRFGFNYININNWESFIEVDENLKRKNDRIDQQINISKAKKTLNWHPHLTYQDWLPEMIEYNLRYL
jgi:GDPmannose 4,6-dehydratase